jgi:hypothetical protein
MEIVGASNNASAMMLPNLSRKESVNSSMTKAQSSNVYANGRGNSSGRRIVPPSANSVANAGHNPKRTVSANNYKNFEDYYNEQSQTVMYDIKNSDILYPGNTSNSGFLPSLTHNNSQQYNQYVSNPQIIPGHMQ